MKTIKTTVKNPIIPGFYSDPSVCRDGEDYYLITSSYEYYPGVPIFHSRDLVNWTQLSYCLTTELQLSLSNAGTSDGIYAPTLRKYKNTFYMITSNRSTSFGNHFYVTAKDVKGPWSEPIWIRDMNDNIPPGVDPSLFFDEDKTAYFTCVAWDEKGQGIGQAQIDLVSGRLLTPLTIIWYGTGGTFPEGPHTYKINGWYFLMIAEGGTEFGHKVTIARSRSIEGPYESCPHNPILTQNYQKSQSASIQGVGHGDLFEAHDGSWWMIVHGFRPSIGKLHHLGRETLLVPVSWDEEGWPIGNKVGYINEEITLQGCFSNVVQKSEYDTYDDFSSDTLPIHWNYLRNPIEENYCYGNGLPGITLLGSKISLNDTLNPTWLGRRQQHFNCIIKCELEFVPAEKEESGLTVFQTNEHHYDVVVTCRNQQKIAFLRKIVGDMEQELLPVLIDDRKITIIIEASREQYTFRIVDQDKPKLLGCGRTQLLSTESMLYQNFTGTYIAMYACSSNETPAPAKFYNFEYIPQPDSYQ